ATAVLYAQPGCASLRRCSSLRLGARARPPGAAAARAGALARKEQQESLRTPNDARALGRAGWRRQFGRRSGGHDGVIQVIRTLAALALLTASAHSLAAASTATAGPALSPTSPWWEKVTVTLAGDGKSNSCRYE